MKNLLILIILLISLCLPVNAVIKGIPLKDDQYAHIFSSAWITEVGKANNLEWWQNLGIILGLSVAKEWYDTQSTGFDITDIGFNLSGYLLSYTFGPASPVGRYNITKSLRSGQILPTASPDISTDNAIPSVNVLSLK